MAQDSPSTTSAPGAALSGWATPCLYCSGLRKPLVQEHFALFLRSLPSSPFLHLPHENSSLLLVSLFFFCFVVVDDDFFPPKWSIVYLKNRQFTSLPDCCPGPG